MELGIIYSTDFLSELDVDSAKSNFLFKDSNAFLGQDLKFMTLFIVLRKVGIWRKSGLVGRESPPSRRHSRGKP